MKKATEKSNVETYLVVGGYLADALNEQSKKFLWKLRPTTKVLYYLLDDVAEKLAAEITKQ